MNEPQPNEEFRHPGDPEGVVRDADGHITDHSKCPARWHDFDPRGADGQRVDERGRRLCNDEGQLTFYCQGSNWYHHAGVDAASCFMIQEQGHDVKPPAYVLTIKPAQGPDSVTGSPVRYWVAEVAGPNTNPEEQGGYVNEADWPRRVVATLQGGGDFYAVTTPEGVNLGNVVGAPFEVEDYFMPYAPDSLKVPGWERRNGGSLEDAVVALLASHEDPEPLSARRERYQAEAMAAKAAARAAGYGPTPGAVTVLQPGKPGAHLAPGTEYVVQIGRAHV